MNNRYWQLNSWQWKFNRKCILLCKILNFGQANWPSSRKRCKTCKFAWHHKNICHHCCTQLYEHTMHTTFCLNTSYSYVGPLKDLRTDRSQTYANKQHNDDQTLFQLVYTVFYMVLLRITFTSRVLDISSWLLRKTRKIRWNVNLSCTDRAVFDRSNGSEITRKKFIIIRIH